MTQEKWQEIRNKIYGVAAPLGTILVTLGATDAGTVEEGTQLLDQALTLGGAGILLFGTILAFVKSLPSRVTTINVPANKVVEVLKTNGEIIAGPANKYTTGTVTGLDV